MKRSCNTGICTHTHARTQTLVRAYINARARTHNTNIPHTPRNTTTNIIDIVEQTARTHTAHTHTQHTHTHTHMLTSTLCERFAVNEGKQWPWYKKEGKTGFWVQNFDAFLKSSAKAAISTFYIWFWPAPHLCVREITLAFAQTVCTTQFAQTVCTNSLHKQFALRQFALT